MAKIAIMTDVNAGLDYVSKEHDCKVLRSVINFGDEHYVDGVEIKAAEFYDRLEKENIVPSTAAPTIGEAMQAIDEFIAMGYTDVIMYPISYKLSCIGSMVESLVDEYKDKINIHVFDTKAAAYMQGYFVTCACEMVKNGATVEEILAYSEYLRNNTHILFVVDDLKYLVKNGRLSSTSGLLGTLFKIKPLLHFDDDGKIVAFEKVRTRMKAIERAKDILLNETSNAKKIKLFIFHTCAEQLAKEVKKDLEEKISKNSTCEWSSELHMVTPAVGAHIGCGIIAMGYYILEK